MNSSDHMTSRRFTWLPTLLVATSIAVPGAGSANEFLWNGDFAIDLDGWQIVDGSGANPTPPEWSSLDVDDSPVSGSALLTRTLMTSGFRPLLRHCVHIGREGRYIFRLSASAYIHGGQQAGSLIVRARPYPTHDCGGDPMPGEFLLEFPSANGTQIWQTRSADFLDLYVGKEERASVLLELGSGRGVIVPDPKEEFRGHFDEIHLTDDRLFAGDFDFPS